MPASLAICSTVTSSSPRSPISRSPASSIRSATRIRRCSQAPGFSTDSTPPSHPSYGHRAGRLPSIGTVCQAPPEPGPAHLSGGRASCRNSESAAGRAGTDVRVAVMVTVLAVATAGLATATSVGAQTGDSHRRHRQGDQGRLHLLEGRSRGIDVRARRRRVQRPDQGGERDGRRQRSEDRPGHRRRQRRHQQPPGGARTRPERQGVRGREQLVVRIPRVSLPARERRPDGGWWLRRQRVRPTREREADLDPGEHLARVRRAVRAGLRRS